jgi:hypothetical protein
VLTSTSLVVIDLINPLRPLQASSLVVAGTASLYVEDDRVFTVGTTNLVVVDVGDPANPSQQSSASAIGSQFTSIWVCDRRAYITNSSGTQGIQVWDVSTTGTPTQLFTIQSAANDSPQDLFIEGGFAYVATQNSFDIYDLGLAYLQQLEVGGFEAASAQIKSNLTVNSDFDVRGGAVFGRGLLAQGPVAIFADRGQNTSTGPGTGPFYSLEVFGPTGGAGARLRGNSTGLAETPLVLENLSINEDNLLTVATGGFQVAASALRTQIPILATGFIDGSGTGMHNPGKFLHVQLLGVDYSIPLFPYTP